MNGSPVAAVRGSSTDVEDPAISSLGVGVEDVAQLTGVEDGGLRLITVLFSAFIRVRLVRGVAHFTGEANLFPTVSWGQFRGSAFLKLPRTNPCIRLYVTLREFEHLQSLLPPSSVQGNASTFGLRVITHYTNVTKHPTLRDEQLQDITGHTFTLHTLISQRLTRV